MKNSPEEKFDKIIKEARAAVLSSRQKETIKSNIVLFLKDHPEPIASKHLPARALFQSQLNTYIGGIGKLLKANPVLRYASLLVLVIFLGGTGVALAAQNALPGDLLYPVKTEIDGKVMALTLFSDQAKAEYDIDMAQLRLEEAETIAAQNKLNDQSSQEVTALLSNHLKDIQGRIVSLKNKGDIRTALGIKTKLEAVLKAHAKIINKLGAVKLENN